MSNNNQCVCCGDSIPEGMQVCPACLSSVLGVITTGRPAHWEINPDGWYPVCSNCWEEPKSGEMEAICPNCGAVMNKKTYRKGEKTVDDLVVYIEEKLEILREMCIFLSREQIAHMYSLTSELEIDNYAHDLIMKGLEE